MAYPIRFRLSRKDTGETFKQWAIRTKTSDAGGYPFGEYRLRPAVDEKGQIIFVDYEDFYLSQKELSAKDWKLEVALSKVGDAWQYQQVGY